jgi:hypothetical protein
MLADVNNAADTQAIIKFFVILFILFYPSGLFLPLVGEAKSWLR